EPLNNFLRSFWQQQVGAAEKEIPDYRNPPLSLTRIKKVMKSDLEDMSLHHKIITNCVHTELSSGCTCYQ
ncbi:hypothetical protein BDR06DRAFT_886384, partial [Suillus hirtellus]